MKYKILCLYAIVGTICKADIASDVLSAMVHHPQIVFSKRDQFYELVDQYPALSALDLIIGTGAIHCTPEELVPFATSIITGLTLSRRSADQTFNFPWKYFWLKPILNHTHPFDRDGSYTVHFSYPIVQDWIEDLAKKVAGIS